MKVHIPTPSLSMMKVSFGNLRRRKSRTFLSLVGVVIGVAAIIALVSVVDGLLSDVNNAIGQVQGVRVLEKGAAGGLFSQVDTSYEAKLERISGVKQVVGTITSISTTLDGEPANTVSPHSGQIIGTDYSKLTTSTAAGIGGEIIRGRELKDGDQGVVVVGTELMSRLNKFVGNKIDVDGTDFLIIGEYETGSALFNSAILMTIQDARELKSFPNDKVSMYQIELANPENGQRMADIINFRWPDDLKAITAGDFSAQFGGILGSVRLMVLGVAAVSAIVAGVGIINTMLMSVMERMKEIGALKATGWTSRNIMGMILYESAFIGVIGGVLGIAVGVAGSQALQQSFGLTVLVTPELALQAFAFAAIMGLVGGLYPAYVASKLDPVQVLHME